MGIARLVWDIDYNLVMALPFVYWPFVYRQVVMASLVVALLVLRAVGLVALAPAKVRAREGGLLIREASHPAAYPSRLLPGQR